MQRVRAIDSHTEGEPTRTIVAGGPDLGGGPMSQRREALDAAHADFRRMTVLEPRGSDVLVGALLQRPTKDECVSGVVFYNNVGTLGMCGHGLIGVARTLAHLGRISPGRHMIETPVGEVGFVLHADGVVEVENVPARRTRRAVQVATANFGSVVGDVAWGGNWFFIAPAPSGTAFERSGAALLTAAAWEVRDALARGGVGGDDGSEIDHIEFTAKPSRADCALRNFVLCPGGAYDRSPCGTGTSAKLACLGADGALGPNERIGVESFVGTKFTAWYQLKGGEIHPTIAGRAWITAELELLVEDDDPCAQGIR